MDFRKVCVYKGFVIAISDLDHFYYCFTVEEWSNGNGYRTPEWELCESVEECKEFIRGY